MKDDNRNKLTNYLQAVLRHDFSVESLQSSKQIENCKRLLVQKAIDHDYESGIRRSEEEYNDLALQAIEKYKNLWQNKQHGDDNRGTTSFGRIANCVMNDF